MMQSRQLSASERSKLINMLPRLRRFSAVLAGDKDSADALLRTACNAMLRDRTSLQPGTAFDVWAFSRVYAHWLETLRSHDAPIAQSQGDIAALMRDTPEVADDAHLAGTLEIVASLPAQQRGAAVLIYGEGFSYDEAASVLETEPATVVARLTRALSTFIDRAEWLSSSAKQSADVQHLQQISMQAGR